jgi:GAF domain-containing protein/HAMP domain-containing protein
MSEESADTLSQKAPTEFRGSLVRTVIISLVLMALLPAAIIGVTSYLQFRSTLKSQTVTQISSLSQTYAGEIEQLNSSTQLSLVGFASSTTIQNAVSAAQGNSNYFYNNSAINSFLQSNINSLASTNSVTDLLATNSEGRIIISSKTAKIGQILSQEKSIQGLVGTANSVILLNPDGAYPNQLVVVTAYTKSFTGFPSPITFLAYSKPTLLSTVLKNPLSYFPTANVFYITSDGKIVDLNSSMSTPENPATKADFLTSITNLIASAQTGKDYAYTNGNGQAVYSYVRPIPRLSSSYILEVPVISVQGQLQSFLRFILILLAAALLLSGLFAFFGARQIAVPLVDLSEKARKFATGDFTQRAAVNRKDEIGLLASSFNYMVNQLSVFYRSLESKVAVQTEKLRTASEIALDAVSAPTTTAILQRVTQSIVEKLGYEYASVYLADKKAENLFLTEQFSNTEDSLPAQNLRMPIDSSSLIGWAAENRQARLSQNVLSERPKLLTAPLLPSTHSEISLPIIIADRLIGVLDIQSKAQNTFDFESLPAFTTITTQISAGLRNIELLESTQLNLQETVVLNTITRAISRAQREEEVIADISNLFNQSAYSCLIFKTVENELHLKAIGDAAPLPSDQSLLDAIIPFENGLNHLRNENVEIIENFQLLTDFSPINAYLGKRGCHSAALIPVFENKKLSYVLAIGTRDESAITSLQVQPYIDLAEAIGVSLERIHFSQSLSQKESEITLLSASFLDAGNEKNLQEVYSFIHEQIRIAFGSSLGLCVALRQDESQPLLSIPYYSDVEPVTIKSYPLSKDLLSKVVNSGESLLIQDASLSNQFTVDSPETRLSAKSWLGVPLHIGSKTIGAIAIFDANENTLFTSEFQTILEIVAAHLALELFIDKQEKNLAELQSKYNFEKYLLDALLENIPDRIAIKNTNNEFIRISKSMAAFLGESDSAKLLGKKDEYHYQSLSGENETAENDVYVSLQTPILNRTEKWMDREGNQRWVVSNRIPLVTSEQTISGLMSISTDITDFVNVQQLAENRANQLQTASEIANESTTGTMDVDVTLNRLVEMIKSRFNFYHASIFLVDPLRKFAILRESTGEAGQQMKQTGHKLAVGSASIVGQATAKGIPVVIGDVTKETNYFANPLLPETRSELAIPMKIGDRILGALDVQSVEYNAFSDEDINILQILANQTAVAVQNENLFASTNQSLSRHRLLNQISSTNVQGRTIEDAIRATIEILHQAMPEEQIIYFALDQQNILSARASSGIKDLEQTSRQISVGTGLIGRVASEGQLIRLADVQNDKSIQPQNFESNSILAVPVKFNEKLLGVINIESITIAKFDENDEEFVTTLAGNMAAIISNITLLEQVRDQVERQQKLFDISSKIRRSVDIDTIMQTSINEIGSALNVRRASIQISPNLENITKKEQEQ